MLSILVIVAAAIVVINPVIVTIVYRYIHHCYKLHYAAAIFTDIFQRSCFCHYRWVYGNTVNDIIADVIIIHCFLFKFTIDLKCVLLFWKLLLFDFLPCISEPIMSSVYPFSEIFPSAR
jgi:hypothetical protein